MSGKHTQDCGGLMLFKAGMDIPYDNRFIKPVQDWVGQITAVAGGNSEEMAALGLAMDETLNFIITAYTDAPNDESIRIDLTLEKSGVVKISISNSGPPVHIDRIPTFDPHAPMDSDFGGLWYFLAKNMVDNLGFKNLGMDGWRADLEKKLDGMTFESAADVKKKPATDDPASAEFECRFATPGDAPDIVDLTYDTYRYSYTAPEFYHKNRLSRLIEKREIVSFLATTQAGIAGNISLQYPSETPACGYIGTLMVKRKFRRSKAVPLLLGEIRRYIDRNPFDKDLYCGLTATAHTLSQIVSARNGLLPIALQLSAGSTVNYRGLTASKGCRESFLLGILLSRPPELERLYLPEAHHDVMAPLMAQAGCSMKLAGTTSDPGLENTRFSIQEDSIENHAYIKMEPGKDWVAELRKKIFNLTSRGMEALTILIPGWNPLLPGIDTKMAGLNTIFCGIKPVSAREYYLVYSTVITPVDFNKIELADPLAVKLKEHINTRYSDILTGKADEGQ